VVLCMALSDRVSLVVITDSVGYKSGMLLVFEELSITLPDVTIQYLRQRNKKREYSKVYHSHPDQKNLCHSIKKESIRKDLKQKADEAVTGLGYGPSYVYRGNFRNGRRGQCRNGSYKKQQRTI